MRGTNNMRYWHAKLKEMKPKGGAKGWKKHQQHHSGNPMQQGAKGLRGS